VAPDTGLREVVSLMCLYRLSGIPVVEGDRLVGIIAEKDILNSLLPNLEDLMHGMAAIDFDSRMDEYSNIIGGKVSDLMTTGVKSVSPDMHILKAASFMAGNHFRRIPVAEGDRLLGILSLGDVHKAIFHANLSVADE
jgi:CBS domain-containing protein